MPSGSLSLRKGKSGPSSSTTGRRKRDAELQAMYQRVRGTQDTIQQLENAVTKLTLTDTRQVAAPSPPPPLPLPPLCLDSKAPQHSHLRQTNSVEEDDDVYTAALQEQMKSLEWASRVLRDASAGLPLVGQVLTFTNDPATAGAYRRSDPGQAHVANAGPFSLRRDACNNALILKYEDNLVKVQGSLASSSAFSHRDIDSLRESLLCSAQQHLASLDSLKEREWNRQKHGVRAYTETRLGNVVNTDDLVATPWALWSSREVLIHAIYLVVLVMHLLEGLTRRATELLLAGFRATTTLTLLYARGSDALSYQDSQLVEDILRDPRAVLRAYNLEPKLQTYTCCSQCFALYPTALTPLHCTYKTVSRGEPCGARLIRTQRGPTANVDTSVRLYLHQSMDGWVGRFVCQPGIEDLFILPTVDEVLNPPAIKRDFHHGSALRSFLGPDGKKLYVDAPEDETRLIFSLAVDGFNPYQNKTAKLKFSSTAIYLVCLSLPPNLRYRPEYMYLAGVIPGPNKPSIEQINHFLHLVVDDLLLFWNPGVRYSRTPKYPTGRLYRAALIPLVCDILGARQVVGAAGHRAKFFCSFCYLTYDQMENICVDSWPSRYPEDHRVRAAEWRDAPTEDERKRLFEVYGVRWSELLRLPYWDPIHYTVVDSMHNLYLGLLQSHCREIWGINPDVDDGDASTNPLKKTPPFPTAKFWNSGLKALYYGTEKQLLGCQKKVLWHLCDRRDLRRAGNVKQLVTELIRWRSKHNLPLPLPTNPKDIVLPDKISEPPPADSLEARIEKAEESLARAKNHRTLIRRTRPVLVAMCASRNIRTDDATVPVLAKRLWDAAQQSKTENNVSDKGLRAALGRQSLEAYEHIREAMELPSWISPAPKGFGTTQRGKLSADQWHTVCTVVLPVALIWKWDTTVPRKAEMLSNFMDLVTAVVIAGLLETSDDHIGVYKEYMVRYLTGMKTLYKEVTMKPNHHLCLHIPDCMELFAPVHSWRSFAFERFNYMLQRLNTNLTIGQLECTFMRTSCRAANLRPLLRDRHVGPAFQEFMEVFNKKTGENERGLRLDAILRGGRADGNAQDVHGSMGKIKLDNLHLCSLVSMLNDEGSSPIYCHDRAQTSSDSGLFVLSRSATRYAKVLISGIYYHSRLSVTRDSNILFALPMSGKSHHTGTRTEPRRRTDPGHTNTHAGTIQDIFVHTRQLPDGSTLAEVFLAVSRFAELKASDRAQDRFRRFAIAGGRLVYDKLDPEVFILRPSQVICHVAKTRLKIMEVEDPCVHILPLDRMLRFMKTQELEGADDGQEQD